MTRFYPLPTLPQNTVDYFTMHGYMVYVPTLRFGRTPVAEKWCAAYDARLDVAAAMEYVHEHGGKMYILCHCVGVIATSMGLLALSFLYYFMSRKIGTLWTCEPEVEFGQQLNIRN